MVNTKEFEASFLNALNSFNTTGNNFQLQEVLYNIIDQVMDRFIIRNEALEEEILKYRFDVYEQLHLKALRYRLIEGKNRAFNYLTTCTMCLIRQHIRASNRLREIFKKNN